MRTVQTFAALGLALFTALLLGLGLLRLALGLLFALARLRGLLLLAFVPTAALKTPPKQRQEHASQGEAERKAQQPYNSNNDTTNNSGNDTANHYNNSDSRRHTKKQVHTSHVPSLQAVSPPVTKPILQ